MKRQSDPFLPYGRQSIGEDDIEAVSAVLRGDYLTTAPLVQQFEDAFARRVGSADAAACANGTAALHLAAMALGLGENDQVIVPSITFLATANGPHHTGAEIVFADVDPMTGLMMPRQLDEAISRANPDRLKAIFPVHLNGQCGDPPGIKDLADRHGLKVVEDACHAVGAQYWHDGARYSIGACTHADLATYSFHPVKAITSGEGGMVTGNDPQLIEKVRLLRNHGMVRDPERFEQDRLAFDAGGSQNPWYYEMTTPGLNYRLSDIQCALGLTQLRKLDSFNARRAELVAHYNAQLTDDLAPLVRPVSGTPTATPAWHLFVVLIDFAKAQITRAQLMRALKRQGIGSQVHYIPVHRQPYYRKRYRELELPGTESYYSSCLSLPLFPEMTLQDADRVVHALRQALL